MRKKMTALFLCISAAAVLAGCGSKAEPEKLVKLGDYSKLEVEVDKSYEIKDSSVKDAIENYFLSTPIYTEDKSKDTVADGDVANINYKGTKDGKAFEGGTAENYNLEIGSGTFIDGFESGLIGKKVGETVDLNLTFPKDYGSEELAGKEVVFRVTINSIQNKSFPTYDSLTDEYVKENYSSYYGVKTVKELKKYVENYLNSNYDTAVGEALTAKLKEISEVGDIPDELLKERTTELKTYYKGLAKFQKQEFADFLQNNYGMSEDDFNKQIKELMPDYIKSDLVWEAVAAKEGIKASGDDYEKFLKKMMSDLGIEKKEALFEVYPEAMVKRMYVERKAKEIVTDKAKIKYVEQKTKENQQTEDASGSQEPSGEQNSDTGYQENSQKETKDTIDTTTGK